MNQGRQYPAMDLSGILMHIESGNDEEIERRLREYNAEVGFGEHASSLAQ